MDTPTLANAIELLNVRNRADGFCHRGMRQITPEMGILCGYAVTVQAITMTPELLGREESVERYIDICRTLEAAPKPAVVVFEEVSGLPEYSAHVGEVLATLFQRFGATGVVSDSAVRDVPEIRQLGLQLFAPGTVASHANFMVESVGQPVTVCGLRIHPGDLLHGDENGLISVPESGREHLAEIVAKIRTKERKILEYLKSSDPVTFEEIRNCLVH